MFLCQGISIQRDLSKDQVRSFILRERDSLSEEVIRSKSEEIEKEVLSTPEYLDSDVILLYVGVRSEVRTDLIMESALSEGRSVYCPATEKIRTGICPGTGNTIREGGIMDFYRIETAADLTESRFGIPEPSKDPSKLFREDSMDLSRVLMIIPGVAFDEERNRIGYRGGYYDRYLGEHPGIRTSALAFDLQVVPYICAEEHDIRPDHIITETRIIR